ncbi:hypothetical protein KKG72_05520 [bacterium]|nr:hypothetical protein [bacterium]MBU1993559.1 hypothetical protein [bacterium]
MPQTYIIGDVHGEYDTLSKLIEKLPKEAEIIFLMLRVQMPGGIMTIQTE